MKYLIKTIMLIAPILGIVYLIGCTKVNDANEKFPQIIADFTSQVDVATGTVTFVSTSKNGNNYFWNFGDNITSTQENPIHSYTRDGNYSITLQVSNAAGAIASITKTINIVIPIMLMPVSLPITFDAVTVDYANNFITTSLPVTLVTNPQLSGSNTAATKVARIVNAGVAGENFGIKLNPGVDITTQKSFTVQIFSTVAIPVGIQLSGGATPNPQNTQVHGGTGWEKLTFTVGGTGTYTNLFLNFGAGTTAGTFFIDDIMQVATVAPTTPPTNAPTPTRSQADVLSIYSDAYTPLTPTPNYFPNWGQSTVVSQINIGTNNILKYANFNYEGTEFAAQNLSSYGFVHIDVWTPNATELKFTPIGGGETLVNLTPLVVGQWNSYDIPLSSFTAVNFASVAQLKFDGQGGLNPSTVFLDNIYFYRTAPPPPPPFNGGMIINGDFEAATSTPWTEGVGPTLAPVVSMGGNKYYSKNVTVVGNPYDVNLSQTGLNIVSGSTYNLTFDAWSSVNRPIIAGIGLSGGSFANNTQTVNITPTRTTYTLATLTANGFGDPNSRAIFDIGAALGVVNIDNVSLVLVPPGGGGGGGGCSGTFVAAPTFPVDFQGCQTFLASQNFGNGITSSIAANPSATGINTSSFALKVEKPAGSEFFAGIQNTFASSFDFTKTFSMQVYSTKAPVTFRFEAVNDPQPPGSGNPGPQFVTITTANTWVPVSFQFTGIPPSNTGCNRLVIKPDNAVGDPPITVSGTYYIDNIRLQ